MSAPGPPVLPPEEYERRKKFLDGLKLLTRAENIEVVRILQKHEAIFSENLNGIFFNVAAVPQTTFDALELFLSFTQSNRRDLADRERYMSSLATLSVPANTLEIQ